MNPRLVVLPLAVLAVGGGIALLSRTPAPPPPPPPPAHPAPAPGGIPKGPWHPQNARTLLAPTVERIPCTVRAPAPVEVLPTVGLTPVETIHVREQQAVKKGDLLVTFSPAPWERELAAARKAGDKVKEEAARRALASLEVRSPTDGIVYVVEARRGERPIERNGRPAPLVILFDWHELTYEATASRSLAEILAKGPLVFVQSGRNRLVEAEVAKSGPAAADGSVPLVLRPKTPPSWVPEPGGQAEVGVMVGTHDAIVVPKEAIVTEGGRTKVFIVPLVGDPIPRNVVLGVDLEGGMVEISGLKMGESVAVWE